MSEYDEACPCCGMCPRDGHADDCELLGAYEAVTAIIADLREGAVCLKSGWPWGGIDSRTQMSYCRTEMGLVLEAAANRFERGEHREENDG